jgi:hypothetical protein
MLGGLQLPNLRTGGENNRISGASPASRRPTKEVAKAFEDIECLCQVPAYGTYYQTR